jgi:N-acetylmuramoyl-L-alanine amidase
MEYHAGKAKGMKIYIDIGHDNPNCDNYHDPGAIGNIKGVKYQESKINVRVGWALAAKLMEGGHDVKVECGNLSITESAKAANEWGADILLSVHNNAGGGDRGEVIYSNESGAMKLADAIAAGLKAAGQATVKIYKRDNSYGSEYYGILRISKMPACIIECAFVDNAEDVKLINTARKQVGVGFSIGEAINAAY